MFGDWVWMSSIIGPLLEPWWILILVAMGDLSFGEVDTSNMTDEEIAELEKAASADTGIELIPEGDLIEFENVDGAGIVGEIAPD